MRAVLVLVFTLVATDAQAVTNACLNMREVNSIGYRDGKTAVFKTRDRAAFEVAFAGTCGFTRFHPQLAFDQTPSGQCLSTGNILNSYDGGACVVSKVTALAPAR